MKLPLSICTNDQLFDFELFNNPSNITEGLTLEIEGDARVIYESSLLAKANLADTARHVFNIIFE